MSITINHQTNDLSIAGGGAPTLGGAAAGGGAWSLVSTQTVSSAVATVDFTSIGSYNRYALKWDCTLSSAQIPTIRFYDNGTLLSSSNYSMIRSNLSGPSSYQITYSGVLTTTGLVSIIGTFEISAAGARWPFYMSAVGFTGTTDVAETMLTSGGLKSTYSPTSLTGFRFTTTGGAAVITEGRFSLYGINQ